MIVARFRMTAQPERASEVETALVKVIEPSRSLPGVVHFDVGRDISDSNSFIATEVFDDVDALERQESLPEVHTAMAVLGEALAAPPEATVFHVSSSQPWGE